MNALELSLDCDQQADGLWRVFDRNTGQTIVAAAADSEAAWMQAAERLAACLSCIRRSACNLD